MRVPTETEKIILTATETEEMNALSYSQGTYGFYHVITTKGVTKRNITKITLKYERTGGDRSIIRDIYLPDRPVSGLVSDLGIAYFVSLNGDGRVASTALITFHIEYEADGGKKFKVKLDGEEQTKIKFNGEIITPKA